jgi:hypothetical protein
MKCDARAAVLTPPASSRLSPRPPARAPCASGVYFPTIGTLRARLLPDEHRGAIMNLFGIPLNLIVVGVFLSISKLGTVGALKCSTTALGRPLSAVRGGGLTRDDGGACRPASPCLRSRRPAHVPLFPRACPAPIREPPALPSSVSRDLPPCVRTLAVVALLASIALLRDTKRTPAA